MSEVVSSQHIDRDLALGLLSAGGVGRIAISVGALPTIVPVRFAFDDDCVVFRAADGTILERATREVVVAFETSGCDPDIGEWLVHLTGVARHVDESEVGDVARALPDLDPGKSCFVAVPADQVDGYRLRI